MVSKEDIIKVAKLAKINLSDFEIEEYCDDFNKILKNIENIKKINIDEELIEGDITIDVLREDEVLSSMDRSKILSNAVDVENGYIKVFNKKGDMNESYDI